MVPSRPPASLLGCEGRGRAQLAALSLWALVVHLLPLLTPCSPYPSNRDFPQPCSEWRGLIPSTHPALPAKFGHPCGCGSPGTSVAYKSLKLTKLPPGCGCQSPDEFGALGSCCLPRKRLLLGREAQGALAFLPYPVFELTAGALSLPSEERARSQGHTARRREGRGMLPTPRASVGHTEP